MKRVFVDNCIMSVSDTMQGARKRQTLNWGGSEQTIEIVGYTRKPLPNKSEAWKREQVECLPTLGRMARQNCISLYTYQETIFEGWKRAGSFPSIHLGNVFEGINIEKVDAAVERSYFFQMELGQYIEKQSVVEFCEWLLAIDANTILEVIGNIPKEFPPFLLNNLRNLERFRELCRGLSTHQYPDALHLWTAEVNDTQYFLTIDRKFIRVMTESKNLELPCRPISPSQLLDELKVYERDPFKYAEGLFYNILGQPS